MYVRLRRFARALLRVAACCALLGACDPAEAPEDAALVGGVDLSASPCQQTIAKLERCAAESPPLADRAALRETCEALSARAPAGEREVAIAGARLCRDRYTCRTFARCQERAGYKLDRLYESIAELAALGPAERPAAVDDAALSGLIYDCMSVTKAGELEGWRARCGRVYEAALKTLSQELDDHRCGALRVVGGALEEGGRLRAAVACTQHKRLLRGREHLLELKRHTEASRWGDGVELCDALTRRRAPGIEDACTEHARRSQAALVDSLRAALTTQEQEQEQALGPVAQELPLDDRCRIYEDAGALLGDDEHAAAKALCDDVALAAELPELLRDVEAALADPEVADARAPIPCRILERKLSGRASTWAKEQRERRFQLCVVALAKIVLPVEVPQMRTRCPLVVRELYEQLAARETLDDPELAPWIEQAAPLCGAGGRDG